MSNFSKYHHVGVKFADILHKSVVTVLATGVFLGSINLGLGFYSIYSKHLEKKREKRLQMEQIEREALQKELTENDLTKSELST